MVAPFDRGGKAEIMASFGINLNGLGEVTANMAKWGEEVNANAAKVVDESLDYGLVIAEGLVPVRTGALKDSLHKEFDPIKCAGTFGSDLDYALYPELGTRYQAAQPYLYPAWKQAQAYLRGNLRRVVQI